MLYLFRIEDSRPPTGYVSRKEALSRVRERLGRRPYWKWRSGGTSPPPDPAACPPDPAPPADVPSAGPSWAPLPAEPSDAPADFYHAPGPAVPADDVGPEDSPSPTPSVEIVDMIPPPDDPLFSHGYKTPVKESRAPSPFREAFADFTPWSWVMGWWSPPPPGSPEFSPPLLRPRPIAAEAASSSPGARPPSSPVPGPSRVWRSPVPGRSSNPAASLPPRPFAAATLYRALVPAGGSAAPPMYRVEPLPQPSSVAPLPPSPPQALPLDLPPPPPQALPPPPPPPQALPPPPLPPQALPPPPPPPQALPPPPPPPQALPPPPPTPSKCPLCWDALQEVMDAGGYAAAATCGHVFCNGCIDTQFNKACPLCGHRITRSGRRRLYFG
ncbi:uncharacterized protein LOC129599994 [Paramacrobiotus metropolitanus]|uniref:uncharacterized protein LOC129599994 n=1 Tax=Paramacrobiotus metropolitanus TaxID=2943436 RepID=UPI002445E298|nr:uncharacterized protein LOC129599994 [Paramacrobiotus metropolitanus]